MAATLIFGWRVKDWDDEWFEPGEGRDIENIFDYEGDSLMVLDYSAVGGHAPNAWVYGFRKTVEEATFGDCREIEDWNFPIPSDEEYFEGKRIAVENKIPIDFTATVPGWYLLDKGDD